ncbi:MAG: hypothetical protein HOV86_01485, partial [Thermoactinospora sp.]|nr:hypothetical protein [Thermoactinospora sp.]
MRDRTAFVAALDRLRTDAGLSWRRLEANARAQSLWLPRATANDAVKRGALPAQQDPAAFITAWTRACGADPEPWLRAWHETEHGTHTVPRHLPADINGFTGRDADLARL